MNTLATSPVTSQPAPHFTAGHDLLSYLTVEEAPKIPTRFPGQVSKHVIQTIGASLAQFGDDAGGSLVQAREFAMAASQAEAGAKAIARVSNESTGYSLQVFDTIDITMIKPGTSPSVPGFGSPVLHPVNVAGIPASAYDTSYQNFQLIELVDGDDTFALPAS